MTGQQFFLETPLPPQNNTILNKILPYEARPELCQVQQNSCSYSGLFGKILSKYYEAFSFKIFYHKCLKLVLFGRKLNLFQLHISRF